MKPRAWQRMLSGRRLDLIDPSALDIEIADIAHGLARVARWNGQTRGEEIFSVAQHSLLVEAIFSALDPAATRPAMLAALLHDAPEYVIGDMISPFKAVMGGGYKETERRLLAAIFIRFGLKPEMEPGLAKAVKAADADAAFYEATELAAFSARSCCASACRRNPRPGLRPSSRKPIALRPITRRLRSPASRSTKRRNSSGGRNCGRAALTRCSNRFRPRRPSSGFSPASPNSTPEETSCRACTSVR